MGRVFKYGKVSILALALLFACNEQSEDLIIDQNVLSSSFQEIPGQYIVVLKDNSQGRQALPEDYNESQKMMRIISQDILDERGIDKEVGLVMSKMINGFVAKLDDNELSKLAKDDRVKYIEKDYLVVLAPPCGTRNGGPCDDPGDGDGGGSGQETPYGITRVNGGVTYTGSNVAWILDTGIDLDHEDLNVDASRGFNAFTSGRDAKSLDDGNGHGSHVAGTVAAVDNSVGVIGVAAGATVIPVKVLDSRGSGSYSGVIAGVDHVGANGANGDVANMSLGGPISQALDDAVLAASNNGIIFSLAAGNESDDANNSSPARVNGANIVTISAMDSNDNWASFSNFGNPPVDYCAPGVSINSTWKGGGYRSISGTSMAAPHAAGVLLLGSASTSGIVNGDPDGNADPIISH